MAGHVAAVMAPEPVAETVGLQGLVAFEPEEGGEEVAAGGIAILHGLEIDEAGFGDAGFVGVGFAEEGDEGVDREFGVAEFPAEMVGQGFGEAAMVEVGAFEIGGEQRLGAGDGTGDGGEFGPDAIPDWEEFERL